MFGSYQVSCPARCRRRQGLVVAGREATTAACGEASSRPWRSSEVPRTRPTCCQEPKVPLKWAVNSFSISYLLSIWDKEDGLAMPQGLNSELALSHSTPTHTCTIAKREKLTSIQGSPVKVPKQKSSCLLKTARILALSIGK